MQKIVILGAGESGVGAALLAKQRGYEVFVSDGGMISETHKSELRKEFIPFEENGHTEDKILDALSRSKAIGLSFQICSAS